MHGVAEAVDERETLRKRAVGKGRPVRQRDGNDERGSNDGEKRVVLQQPRREYFLLRAIIVAGRVDERLD